MLMKFLVMVVGLPSVSNKTPVDYTELPITDGELHTPRYTIAEYHNNRGLVSVIRSDGKEIRISQDGVKNNRGTDYVRQELEANEIYTNNKQIGKIAQLLREKRWLRRPKH